MNLLTVCWEGDFRRRTYTAEWAWRLEAMAKRVCPTAKLHTLANVSDVPGYIPLHHDWPGWWSKIELFRPDLPFDEGERLLYLDLDTLIIRGLEEIYNFPASIAFAPPSYVLEGRPAPTSPPPGVVNKYASVVTVFNKGKGRIIYDAFSEREIDLFRGDQDWISHIFDGAATLPPQWFMKLKHCVKGPPEQVKLVYSMPLKCDVAARRISWVGEMWTR